MINVSIVVNDRCQASSVFAITDLIMAANYALQHYFNTHTPLFSYQLVGLKSNVRAYNGNKIENVVKIQNCERPDLVILPGAFESVLSQDHVKDLLATMPRIFSTLKGWHDDGTVIASTCTGNFILASSDIACGRSLTCHWASKATANTLFPNDSFDIDKLIIDHGDIISAGGAMAASQLVLYLISRFHSRELAMATGKLMLVELNLDLQSRFSIFKPDICQSDSMVANLQNHIEASLQEKLKLDVFAKEAGISSRQLSRRFKKATGETPLSYLQRFRIEKVKIGLESTNKPISALVWEVGYEDLTSFRRLFRRFTGLTMQEYRGRFSYLNSRKGGRVELISKASGPEY